MKPHFFHWYRSGIIVTVAGGSGMAHAFAVRVDAGVFGSGQLNTRTKKCGCNHRTVTQNCAEMSGLWMHKKNVDDL
ncbi:unnamed protein product [Coffea canephora]|uniref:Uncharacterized protein n=1 Tax=Coffea canephora TaxID=49390 RepID=A0A068U0F4_COFCA|nr:unnamed protein product [Coffea canephora]